MPRLSYPRGDRWPILVWAHAPKSEREMQAWIDRGVSPLFLGSRTAKGMRDTLPAIRFFHDRGVPAIFLPQGALQIAFKSPQPGKEWLPGCDHEPPAQPVAVNHDFGCPAWLYENPYLAREAAEREAMCQVLKEAGIEPAAVIVDFESGAYLRNGAESEERLRPAMDEALKCPRCLKRFGAEALDTFAEYSAVTGAARAAVAKLALVDPVRRVFADCKIGNFFAWPVRRTAAAPGMHPAYGYEGSGMDVAQPRRYFTAGWRGCDRDENKADWVALWCCITDFSPCARVLREGEVLVPWLGIVSSREHSQEKRGRAFATPEGYAEATRHLLLRGAETLAMFLPPLSYDFPDFYGDIPRKEVGPWIMITEGVQRGYNDMLRFNEILRQGKVLNYDASGEPYTLDESATVWSGVATGEAALIRTITFGPEGTRVIKVFGRDIEAPFGRQGRFFWVFPDGSLAPVEQPASRPGQGE